MIHAVVTCDICNPQDGTQGIVKLPYPNEGRGIFDGPLDAAEDAGWLIDDGEDRQVCPECRDREE